MKLPTNTLSPEVLKERLERFALDVFALTVTLLPDLATKDALQLRRSSTAAYVNYGSACVARSHADFTSKIGIAFEEADESRNWLTFIKNAGIAPSAKLTSLLAESRFFLDWRNIAHRINS